MPRIAAALTLSLLVVLSGCASLSTHFEPPKLDLVNIQILEVSGFSLRLALDLRVQNPNPVPLPISGLSYSLGLNGNEVLSGVAADLATIGAYQESLVRLEASTNFLGMMGLMSDLLSGTVEEVQYQLDASIGVQGLARPLKVSETGLVPLTH